MTTLTEDEAAQRAGFIAALSAYSIWGVLPLYLKLVGFADAREILAMRILWSAPAALAAVWALGGLMQLRQAFQPRMFLMLGLSALFIFGNWAIFVWAVTANRVIEAALAYFLAPLVNVAFGVAFFAERLRVAQIVALALAAAGVVLQGVALGAPPVISLVLCMTWCLYGLVRKQAVVASAAGLLVETLWLAPAAAGILVWAALDHELAFIRSAGEGMLLALSGPVTAIPLILFAFGARRLSFSTLGLLQFIAPSFTFLVGLAYGEPFTPLRAASFGLIWAGLCAYCWDAFRRERR